MQNPTHTYGTKGTYTAKVTVEDGSGATATKTITITVTDPAGNQAPTIEDHRTRCPQGELGVPVHGRATDPEDEALTYEWDFGDGSAKSTGADVTHTFPQRRHLQRQADGVKDPHGAKATQTRAGRTSRRRPTRRRRWRSRADPASGTAPLPVQFSSQVTRRRGRMVLRVELR